MVANMETLPDIFDAFDGPAELGRALGITTELAAGMRRRNSIPVRYWPTLIAAARERRISGITYESLTHIHVDARAGAS